MGLVEIITAADEAVRNRALDGLCAEASLANLLGECEELERFRRRSDNLYERVRALLFLYAIHRFHLPRKPGLAHRGRIPFAGYELLLHRRFEEAIAAFRAEQASAGPSDAISSALAVAYHDLGFQTLADQVRQSVRSVQGNRWMFRVGHPADQPLRVRPELLARGTAAAPFPILRERTPVRLDLSHSGWSDIFFLGMDYPEGARVLNVSIDLAVRGRDDRVRAPIETWFRVVDAPVLRLTSVDLGATVDIRDLAEVFDFAKDYLGLLKAAVIAAGLVPPGIEGCGESLVDLLVRLVGPGYGIEIVSHVRDIPKGSRLAVSTSLLASLIAVSMRATGQTRSLCGPLEEGERRTVAARAILGEWLGGSGGGWQDSGGLWPGMKLIRGRRAAPGDPEHGISRGCLLPDHTVLGADEVPPVARDGLCRSLVLVHGGMAQNVGPILEMVTEKYLLRCEREWLARQDAIRVLDEVRLALREADVGRVGAATTRNFFGPIQGIIPWATNLFTETVISRVKAEFGADYHGFVMLGGMSGGGMGFFFAESARCAALDAMQGILTRTKAELARSLPFAMDPVVYDFAINDEGSRADLLAGDAALLPAGYYALVVPGLLRADPLRLTPGRRAELDHVGAACRVRPDFAGVVSGLFDRLLPRRDAVAAGGSSLAALLAAHGFDRTLHETVRRDLQAGRIGLGQNRLPANTAVEDVGDQDVVDTVANPAVLGPGLVERGREAISRGEVAVVTLAAGAASRWTQGAGVVKALHPFARVAGQHRTFLEVHLAKTRRAGREHGVEIPHVITTSLFTHDAIEDRLRADTRYGQDLPVLLSPGRSVGLRMVPMVRDLRFAWEELPQQRLDERAQKVRDSLHAALISWAQESGEGSDYRDNLPMQCLHPVGHWFEIPNLLRNGVLVELLARHPRLRHLMVHNVDTLGADLDPGLLGLHIEREACLSFEVIPRRIEDRGGGLACVNGRPRLVEGLAMPREEDEFRLSFYNTNTSWVDVDRLLAVFGIARTDLDRPDRLTAAIRALGARLPTYVTLKDVKKRWGHGQEDVFPVTQFEKLWGDMTALAEVACSFVVVPRLRGQQLKDPAQLDGWLRDGSAEWVAARCGWK